MNAKPNVPHVLVLPFPAQGHVKPMLMLAELLSRAGGFQVTFINTDHNQDRIQRFTDIAAFCSRFPNKFRFMSVPDGLPPDHPRTGDRAIDFFFSTRAVIKPEFRKLVIDLSRENGGWEPFTCIIADGIMSFAIDVAEEMGIPVITFRTYSASCTWTYFFLSKLVDEGEVPFQAAQDMDKAITCIPGFEDIMRRRDLPSMCRLQENIDSHSLLQFFITETAAMPRASALLLNTFDALESSVISRLGSLFTKIYTIGPLHALLETFRSEASSTSPANSSYGFQWKEDRSCMTWLDAQPSRSVIYVSFGSSAGLTPDQLLEFWYGLVNSGKPFLWVIRPDSIIGENYVGPSAAELEAATKQRGCIVSWAPQVEVLAHPAIGGFLTHSGWNSTLESIFAGVPMICWPQITDQPVNSRCVSELWQIGFDMKDACDRSTVERMVKDLMERKSEEIAKSTVEISSMARDCVAEGGSSYGNLAKLIEDIRAMSLDWDPSKKKEMVNLFLTC